MVEQASGVAALGPIRTRWEFIDPVKAGHYLSLMGRNRRLNKRLVEMYAKDMADGNWPVTHQGLAFDEQGRGIDAQHRLHAVVASGRGQWFLVTQGLPPEAVEGLDKGARRTMSHTLQIVGAELSSGRAVAVARRMMIGPMLPPVSRSVNTDMQTRRFMEAHAGAVAFAVGAVSKSKAPACVTAAIGRAYYHVEGELLVRFCQALTDDVPDEDVRPIDKVARLLRAAIQTKNLSTLTLTHLYRKAQNAIAAWVEGRQLHRLLGAEEDLFPLPERPAGKAS
jgi:hypothetical protein